jgi:hypothetical protein
MVEHPVKLRGADFASLDGPPVILARTEQDFLPVLLQALRGDGRAEAVRQGLPKSRDRDGLVKLFQPVHRSFNVALVEAACDTYGQPRIDPVRLESAGLVVRRQAVDRTGQLLPGVWEGWMQADGIFRGWVRLSEMELAFDPDPARRPPALKAGHPIINARLANRHGPAETLAERVAALYPAPPDVCQAARKTLLFGVIPVTSSEMAEAPKEPLHPAYDLAETKDQLHYFLRVPGPHALPWPGWLLNSLRAGANRLVGSLDDAAFLRSGLDENTKRLVHLMVFIRQLAVQLDAFGASPAGQALFQELNQVRLESSGQPVPAGDFLKAASEVLLEQVPNASGSDWRMPSEWPLLSGDQLARFAELARGALNERLSQIAGGERRFDAPGRRYHVRAFIRVRSDHPGCPPRLVWSRPSDPFTIAPWYEAGDAPPAQVPLPNLADRAELKKLKPNVAFVMPESLFNLLKADPKKLRDGDAEASGGVAIQWICSFSIPIITLCAFIVLNIFLQLFNLIFQWLLYIKICLPLPKPK